MLEIKNVLNSYGMNVGIVYEYVAKTKVEEEAISSKAAASFIRALAEANPDHVLFLPDNKPPMIVVHADLRQDAKTALRADGFTVLPATLPKIS